MTSEQQALLDKAQRSLEAAQSLIEQKFFDFAVSRAYYAMFMLQKLFSIEKDSLSLSTLLSSAPLGNI